MNLKVASSVDSVDLKQGDRLEITKTLTAVVMQVHRKWISGMVKYELVSIMFEMSFLGEPE